MDLISLVIINYNNKSYLKRCLDSIESQTYKNLEIIFIDNESKDGSFEYMKEEYSEKNILLLKNEVNNGYAGAANQGIRLSNGKYVMILNPDIIMENNFIENLWRVCNRDENIGAITGKLLKYDFKEDKKLKYIDSLGIKMTKNREFFDIAQGKLDDGKYDYERQIFGVCGAAPFFSRKALEDIKVFDEYFDEDFFAYKEDIDVSWRLNNYGYKCMYTFKAVAYHGRGFDKASHGFMEYVKNRKNKSKFIRKLSFRNHILVQIKNETNNSKKGSSFAIKKRNIKFYLYVLLIEPEIINAVLEIKKLRKKMLIKKEESSKKRKYTEEWVGKLVV